MANSNLKLIARNFWKNRLFSSINIVGLAIGIACAIIIFLFVEYELGFDRFNKNHENIYRIVRDVNHINSTKKEGSVTYMLSGAMQLEFPEYKFTGLFNSSSQDVVVDGIVYSETNILYVDSIYFNIFEYEWLIGSPELITANKHNLAITQSLAKKYFKNENPIGKRIRFSADEVLQVVGVLKDPPRNSSQPYSMIANIDFWGGMYMGIDIKNWGTDLSGFETYVEILNSSDPIRIGQDITKVVKDKYVSDEQRNNDFHYALQSITQIHLQPDYQNVDNTYVTSKQSLWIYSSIGLLIVIIAGINFINLSTAHALKRSKEVGVKKVLGASNLMISRQFLLETFMLTFIATVMAVIIVEISLPYINAFFGNNTILSIYGSNFFFVFILLIYIIVGLLTGLYPAFVLSSFKPINALKNIFNAPKKRSLYFRNSLVVLQFTISIVLLICTITIHRQMKYIDNFDLGFNKDNIVLFNLPANDEQSLDRVSTLLRNDPGVMRFSFASGAPNSNRNLRTSFVPPSSNTGERYDLNVKIIDTAYKHAFDLKLLAGRWIYKKHPNDSLFEIIVNEKFCEDYGFESPQAAIDQKVELNFISGHIRGVLQNFHLTSLKRSIEAAAFVEIPNFYFETIIKLHPGRTTETLERVQAGLAQIFPDNFITHENYDDTLKARYEAEQQASTTITVFSILAIFIASLGLFGLVSFMIVQRLKEISVRKVLGASLIQNMGLLFKSYLKLVLVACVVAMPIGWYAMSEWLAEFQYKISISWWIYVLAALFSIVLAMITILYHVIKSSNANPVESLTIE